MKKLMLGLLILNVSWTSLHAQSGKVQDGSEGEGVYGAVRSKAASIAQRRTIAINKDKATPGVIL